ncbi:SEC-C domain-containing protein [Hazenella sp. IB182353]|uniref:SEC-C metal-binding domain-containing protein n=1 Tax=Polycladospora coralii TaxID=2771432 RepID=UPI001746F858|nr:SEC-C metal-binding domain-containing protein [Polycladospora coralii]MBS7530183.1 SEC-C domain-containing protein [Polycladospora coralii]
MVGRNEACPCGSGKKYKKCCERVVAIASAEQARQKRDHRLKKEVMTELIQWYTQNISSDQEKQWTKYFKEMFKLSLSQPIPEHLERTYRYWLLFDVPCQQGKRPIEEWIGHTRLSPPKARLAEMIANSKFTCYEIKEIREKEMILCSIVKTEPIIVKREENCSVGQLIFARLIKPGSMYEVFGPYTAIQSALRREILVQLEKFLHPDTSQLKRQTWDEGWKALGLAIQQTKSFHALQENQALNNEQNFVVEDGYWPVVDFIGSGDVPSEIIQHIEQFFLKYVASLQTKTQALYSESVEYLYKYITLRYGQTFRWSLIDEEMLNHFLAVWYLDQQKKPVPNGARVFLNTLKQLFRWLAEEHICEVYKAYQNVYKQLVRALPSAIEIGRWIEKNVDIVEKPGFTVEVDRSLFTTSAVGSMVSVNKKWIPIQMNGFPSLWKGDYFWICGKVVTDSSHAYITEFKGVYPFVVCDSPLPLLKQP